MILDPYTSYEDAMLIRQSDLVIARDFLSAIRAMRMPTRSRIAQSYAYFIKNPSMFKYNGTANGFDPAAFYAFVFPKSHRVSSGFVIKVRNVTGPYVWAWCESLITLTHLAHQVVEDVKGILQDEINQLEQSTI